MIKIISRKEGFRRLGVAHSEKATTYPDGHWTPEQLEVLRNEPMLTVQEIATEEDKSKVAPPTGRPNAADSIAAIKAATTLDELNKLAEGEDRKTVMPAIDARRTELQG